MNHSLANKVATVTLLFWIMKICATTLGETAGNLLSMTMNVGYATNSLVLMSVFIATRVVQMVSREFRPVIYWSVILSTSTAGTTMSDSMNRTLGWGYATGSMFLVSCLVITLAIC